MDVFRTEPLRETSPLWKAKGVVITPHIAAVSDPSFVAELTLDNMTRLLDGRPLLHAVDFEAGY